MYLVYIENVFVIWQLSVPFMKMKVEEGTCHSPKSMDDLYWYIVCFPGSMINSFLGRYDHLIFWYIYMCIILKKEIIYCIWFFQIVKENVYRSCTCNCTYKADKGQYLYRSLSSYVLAGMCMAESVDVGRVDKFSYGT